MSRRLIVRGEAEADLTEAALWYDERETGLGLELTLEVRTAIGRAVENPLHHLSLRHRPEVRRVLARRFPYRIFFIVRDDALVVLPSSMPPVTTGIGGNGYDLWRASQPHAR